jgi:hypothetical protein
VNTKFLMSVGSAIAANKFVKNASRVRANDVLGYAGLARRQSHLFGNLALIGIGALAGAGAALLFAPTNGPALRERLSFQLTKAKDAATDALYEAKLRAPALLEQARDKVAHQPTRPA